jgi:hypothetical protein
LLRNATLLVIGAGASSEVNLPLGSALAEQISSKFDFKFEYGRLIKDDDNFFDVLKQQSKDTDDLNRYIGACRRIRGGVVLARSIDNYIDSHRDDHDVMHFGKLAIVDAILTAERKSNLWIDFRDAHYHFDMQKLGNTWYCEFASILCDGVSKNQLGGLFEKLSVISFNYDRCLQQALSLYICTLYHLSFQDSRDIVSKIRIIYPYGSIGPFPDSKNGDAIDYGIDIDKSLLFGLSKRIRTYSEQALDRDLFISMKSEFAKAETVIFLGCAYHPQNVRILSAQVNSIASINKKILGTAVGLSLDGVSRTTERLIETILSLPNGHNNYESLIPTFLGKYIKLHSELSCSALIKYYRQSLLAQ